MTSRTPPPRRLAPAANRSRRRAVRPPSPRAAARPTPDPSVRPLPARFPSLPAALLRNCAEPRHRTRWGFVGGTSAETSTALAEERDGGRTEVLLFCGGCGMRMRDGICDVPEPVQTVGPRPLLRHVMRFHAHLGHTDLVLGPGYRAEHVEDRFPNCSETGSNDSCCAAARSRCWGPTSPTGRSRSCTPGSIRRSGSGCAGCAATSPTRSCSWPTAPMSSRMRRWM